MEEADSELQRLESNYSELQVHHETLKKQLAFKNEQLGRVQAAVKEAEALLTRQPPVKLDNAQ
jgi:chromosome segregation ATPase